MTLEKIIVFNLLEFITTFSKTFHNLLPLPNCLQQNPQLLEQTLFGLDYSTWNLENQTYWSDKSCIKLTHYIPTNQNDNTKELNKYIKQNIYPLLNVANKDYNKLIYLYMLKLLSKNLKCLDDVLFFHIFSKKFKKAKEKITFTETNNEKLKELKSMNHNSNQINHYYQIIKQWDTSSSEWVNKYLEIPALKAWFNQDFTELSDIIWKICKENHYTDSYLIRNLERDTEKKYRRK